MSELLFKNEWLEVRKKDYYIYIHYPDGNGQGVLILPYRKENGQYRFLGVNEVCLAHEEFPELYAVGGGMLPSGDALESAVKEMKEETGYTIEKERFASLGTCYLSKSCDTIMHLFCVEITEDDIQDLSNLGDGTIGEENISPVWVDEEELIYNRNPLFHVMLLRWKDLKR